MRISPAFERHQHLPESARRKQCKVAAEDAFHKAANKQRFEPLIGADEAAGGPAAPPRKHLTTFHGVYDDGAAPQHQGSGFG